MFPVLLSIGPVVIYTANVLYLVGWCIFSFLFWRYLRSQGMLEERIFDLTFYGTIAAIIGARLGFVFLYPKLFSASLLLVGAFWVQPGLWIYSGFLGILIAFYLYCKRLNIRFAQVFDAFVFALPWALLPIVLGIFFAGEEVGKISAMTWGMKYPKFQGIRYPVQLYELFVLLLIGIVGLKLAKRALNEKWQLGLLGSGILMLLSPLMFALEFLKVGPLYLYGISINQWILIFVFAETAGMVFTKGGLHERIIGKFRGRNAKKVVPGETANPGTNQGA